MTLPVSGGISLSQIQSEFNVGTNLNSYRSQRWYLDTNARGYFPSGTISFSDFYSKRKNSPVTPSPTGGITYTSVPSGGVPFPTMFNNLTVTVVSGQGGTAGQSGNCRSGTGGGNGGPSNFGDYAGTGYGSPAGYGGSGSQSVAYASWAITDENQASILALYSQSVSSGVGGGGGPGGPGNYNVQKCVCQYYGGKPYCGCADYCEGGLNGGSGGAGGYINLSWT